MSQGTPHISNAARFVLSSRSAIGSQGNSLSKAVPDPSVLLALLKGTSSWPELGGQARRKLREAIDERLLTTWGRLEMKNGLTTEQS